MTTAHPDTRLRSLGGALAVYLTPRVLAVTVLGFASGLPLALSGSTLSIWMRESKVDLGTIGLFALIGTPYTLKFLWAPLVDALGVPILSAAFGRRRGWMLFSQLLLLLAILLLALQNPAQSLGLVALAALLVAAAAATQDIVIDVFRVESLPQEEQAAGVAAFIAAYRIGVLVSTSGALFLVSRVEALGVGKQGAWMWGYVAMAALVGIGMITTLCVREPASSKAAVAAPEAAEQGPLARVFRTALQAFQEFLTRDAAVVVLLFVVLYKLCDAFAGAMTAPFVIDIGFTRDDYAAIVKGAGLVATLAGGFAGGLVARALPITTSLWLGAALQMASNLVFTWQAWVGVNHWALTLTILVENFTGGIGTVIFVAYLSGLCRSPLHTATQFALLSALAAVGRTYLSAVAGYVAERAGWPLFFALSALTALPSLAVLAWLQARGHFDDFIKPTVMRTDD